MKSKTKRKNAFIKKLLREEREDSAKRIAWMLAHPTAPIDTSKFKIAVTSTTAGVSE